MPGTIITGFMTLIVATPSASSPYPPHQNHASYRFAEASRNRRPNCIRPFEDVPDEQGSRLLLRHVLAKGAMMRAPMAPGARLTELCSVNQP